MSTDSLARLWGTRGFSPDRLLFVTYSFNFREFHNTVLPRLIKTAGGADFLRIDVLASEHDGETSDCFNLRHCVKLGQNFRLFLTKRYPLVHAKAILAVDSRNRKRLTGIGSANLTRSGWRENIEAWDWRGGGTPEPIYRLLQRLEDAANLPPGTTAEWMRWGGRGPQDPTVQVLAGDPAADAFNATISKLRAHCPRPSVVRIISPYFDSHSATLIERLDHQLSAPAKLEIWIDGSGRLTERTHLQALRSALGNARWRGGTPEVWAVRSRSSAKRADELVWAPLHAKIIEFEANRNISRSFGSANFTGAAWAAAGRGNVELVGISARNRTSFRQLVEARYVAERLTPQALKALESAANPGEPESTSAVKVLWARLTEGKNPRIEARVSARSDAALDASISATFDQTRSPSDSETLRLVAARVSDSRNWAWTASWEHGSWFIVGRWTSDKFVCCEEMALRVRIGRVQVEAPIWVTPDPTRRDRVTGIPLDPDTLTINRLLDGGAAPIVGPRSGSGNDEEDEAAAEADAAMEPAALAFDHADYDYHPALILLKKRYQASDKEARSWLLDQLSLVADEGLPVDRVIARAALRGFK